MMKSGLWDIALILLIAVCSVAVTSRLAGLLKPMWLSLICTKLKSPPLPALRSAVLANARDIGMPPLMVQTNPVPAHAMHFRNPRRSTPSLLKSSNLSNNLHCNLNQFGSNNQRVRVALVASVNGAHAGGHRFKLLAKTAFLRRRTSGKY